MKSDANYSKKKKQVIKLPTENWLCVFVKRSFGKFSKIPPLSIMSSATHEDDDLDHEQEINVDADSDSHSRMSYNSNGSEDIDLDGDGNGSSCYDESDIVRYDVVGTRQLLCILSKR